MGHPFRQSMIRSQIIKFNLNSRGRKGVYPQMNLYLTNIVKEPLVYMFFTKDLINRGGM